MPAKQTPAGQTHAPDYERRRRGGPALPPGGGLAPLRLPRGAIAPWRLRGVTDR